MQVDPAPRTTQSGFNVFHAEFIIKAELGCQGNLMCGKNKASRIWASYVAEQFDLVKRTIVLI